ncbi:MAG TPA: enoyl-CoA hydratase/isomerase family protein [Vicinamibacteria bacterium]|nr:enoyl-CoA hydratase/isomerase family protein [Vicinamibacteria bacterium]
MTGLTAAGVDADLATRFLHASREDVHTVFALGWEILDRFPLRSARSEAEKRASTFVIEAMADVCWRFCRTNRRNIYDRLTDGMSKRVRLDDLVFRAAERWPGLVPTREDLARESERMQKDKDGREIQQGLFVSQMLSDSETGAHLVSSMLEPTGEARERLQQFRDEGALQLGTVRVEARGHVGHVEFQKPRFLNAEDDETRQDLETAIDLVLLHPELRIGVLRGGRVEHPKYPGQRIFSAGLNLTKLYHGKIPYLFYLLRDLGPVNKLYRGLQLEDHPRDEPETTLEKPWIAVVEGFAIGGGCQMLLVVDRVIAQEGSYFNLPARKEGIVPGAANLRLPRFLGEGLARDAILFGRTFSVDSVEARAIVSEVHPADRIDDALEQSVATVTGSGLVSASGNRKALRVQTEPRDTFRRYMATYARDQAYCHLSEQLVENLENHWQARTKSL